MGSVANSGSSSAIKTGFFNGHLVVIFSDLFPQHTSHAHLRTSEVYLHLQIQTALILAAAPPIAGVSFRGNIT